MPAHHTGTQSAGPDRTWSRPRTLAALTCAGLVVLLLAAGLVLAAASALRPAGAAPGAARTTVTGSDPRVSGPGPTAAASVGSPADLLAAAPLPPVPEQAARPAPMSTAVPPRALLLPPPAGIGPAGVATGFPRTEQGAVAQLAEIDRTVLSAASLPAARELIGAWAVPGGPTAGSWSGVRALAALLAASGTSGGATGQLTVLATPLMGLVKGSLPAPNDSTSEFRVGAGPDLVVACVDLEVDVTVTSTARAAVADCQRMLWNDRRWMIGPGVEPAAAPSVWPGTDLAYAVGWRDLRPATGPDTPDGTGANGVAAVSGGVGG